MESSKPTGTIIYSSVGRADYGFDVFSLNLNTRLEHRLTDGTSINFNAQFIDDNQQSIVFISERTGSSQIYQSRPNSSNPPDKLQSAPASLFHDRPILHNNRLYFVSAHEVPHSLYNSWPAVYSANTEGGADHEEVTRLTPIGVVDYSPAISKSGEYIAVASYGSKTWEGDFNELNTQIVVFPVSDPTKRTVLAQRGGWPTWSGDDTVYFHRVSDDGWWSIYRVNFSPESKESSPTRVTSPGVHAFTPAAFHDGTRIAVATRRKDTPYRHIEIFDVNSGKFQQATELLNPAIHHYNPFVSPGSNYLGYHRFRGDTPGQKTIPNFEPISSPIKPLTMIRCNGNFPSVSPDGELVAVNPELSGDNGGITVMKSDGSKRWSLISGRIAFYNSWCQADKNVIFTSLGGIFQPAHVTVQVARVSFDSNRLDPTRGDVENVEVKLLTKEDTGNNAFPACSPDGKSVVFRSGRSGQKNLYLMDAVNGEFEGGFIRKLTEGPWVDTMPNWSPDGEWIAFSSNRHDPTNPVTFGIYMVRSDGSDIKRVHVEGSNGVAMERINHVCFSPNGEWLLFTSNMGGVTAEPVSFPNQFQPYGDLFVVRVDGTELTRLTCDGYENGTPMWYSGSRIDHVDLERLSLNGHANVDEVELKGQIQEPFWINCNI